MKGRWFAAALVLGIPLFLDLATKSLAQNALVHGEPLVVLPGFNLTLLFNSGVSFGFFPVGSSTGLIIMLLLQAVLSFGIAVFGWFRRNTASLWPVLLFLSGALSNFLDRCLNGAVTDFVDLYIGGFHWPAFNLADVWITIGILGWSITEFVPRTGNDKNGSVGVKVT